MAVVQRPYFVVFKGVEHMVEAAGPAHAARHVVSDEITELRPARANEVLAWQRAGKPVEVAGQKPAAPAPEIEGKRYLDARWFLRSMSTEEAKAEVDRALDHVFEEEMLSLDDFRSIRFGVPAFPVMLSAWLDKISVAVPVGGHTVDGVVNAIEREEIGACDVVKAVELMQENLREMAEADGYVTERSGHSRATLFERMSAIAANASKEARPEGGVYIGETITAPYPVQRPEAIGDSLPVPPEVTDAETLELTQRLDQATGPGRRGNRRLIPDPYMRDQGGIDALREGYFLVRRGDARVPLPVRISFGPPLDDDGQPLDRSWRWQIHICGVLLDGPMVLGPLRVDSFDDVWPVCAGEPIDEADYLFRIDRAEWAAVYDDNDPHGSPGGRIDPMTATLPFLEN